MCKTLTQYPNGFELDHVQALDNEGTDTEDNTQVLCIPRHAIKTARDMGYTPPVIFGPDGRIKW